MIRICNDGQISDLPARDGDAELHGNRRMPADAGAKSGFIAVTKWKGDSGRRRLGPAKVVRSVAFDLTKAAHVFGVGWTNVDDGSPGESKAEPDRKNTEGRSEEQAPERPGRRDIERRARDLLHERDVMLRGE